MAAKYKKCGKIAAVEKPSLKKYWQEKRFKIEAYFHAEKKFSGTSILRGEFWIFVSENLPNLSFRIGRNFVEKADLAGVFQNLS